jgi:hypothetical protein
MDAPLSFNLLVLSVVDDAVVVVVAVFGAKKEHLL